MKASSPGPCNYCGQRISKGDPVKVTNTPAGIRRMHPACYDRRKAQTVTV